MDKYDFRVTNLVREGEETFCHPAEAVSGNTHPSHLIHIVGIHSRADHNEIRVESSERRQHNGVHRVEVGLVATARRERNVDTLARRYVNLTTSFHC